MPVLIPLHNNANTLILSRNNVPILSIVPIDKPKCYNTVYYSVWRETVIMVVRPLLLFNIIVYLGFLSTLLYILFPDNFMIKNTISHSKSVQVDSEEDAWNLAKKNIPKLSKTKKDYHNGKTMSDMKTYGELNAFMCTHQRKLPDIERPKVKRKRCPGANGIVTVYPGGRIGK